MKNIDKIKHIVWAIIRRIGLGPWILRWHPKSYMRKIGWFRSFNEWKPVDLNGQPLPWLTYSFIDFVMPRLSVNFRMFEFGCGYSTIWFSNHVKEVISVEHAKDWMEKINFQLPNNAVIIFASDKDSYIEEIKHHGNFEIILIDGIYRNECLQNAINSLSPDGVVIFDNSDRDDYKISYSILRNLGFKEIYFVGIAPSDFNKTRTSIFYKENNCLNI